MSVALYTGLRKFLGVQFKWVMENYDKQEDQDGDRRTDRQTETDNEKDTDACIETERQTYRLRRRGAWCRIRAGATFLRELATLKHGGEVFNKLGMK